MDRNDETTGTPPENREKKASIPFPKKAHFARKLAMLLTTEISINKRWSNLAKGVGVGGIFLKFATITYTCR